MRSRLALLLFVLSSALAGADEWYDAYRQGMRALAQGRGDNAVALLERAIAQRPEPGRNVVTYGTNVEREYFPYLRLAEAHLLQRDATRARAALDRSERWGREPAEQRQRLAARVEELVPKATPHAAPNLPPPPTAVPPATTAVEAPPPAIEATPLAPASTPAARAAAGQASPASQPVPPPIASPVAGETASLATLDVVSQPPGASVYVDDELVGTTDQEWGRLVRSGLTPGRHRVRLALAGHQDLAEDVDLAAGARVDFRRRLGVSPPADRGPMLYAAVALLLLGLTAWAVRRLAKASSAPPSLAITPRLPPTPRSAANPSPGRGTPAGMVSPGVRRDAQGREFFGEYRLLEPLGRGGMASVVKAERDGELCALKRPLYAFLEEPEFLERFLREAEIGRTLHHPNVIRILERGEVESVPFFTMELLPGETLQALLERVDVLPPEQAARIVVQIAEALDYAHSKGVVHRDLKPSNVMVLPDGTAKVMDFGIARARRFEGMTVTGAFLGSPDYIAPEAIEGREADARSDLYSLGVTFFEALTGRRPFAADTPFAVLRQHLTATPPSPSSVRPEVPAELSRLVERLLSKTPEDRPASAEDLVLELRDYLHHAA